MTAKPKSALAKRASEAASKQAVAPSGPPTAPEPNEAQARMLQEIGGSGYASFNQAILSQLANIVWLGGLSKEEQEAKFMPAWKAAAGIKPTSEIEGMLAAQMTATHFAAMECFRRAMIPEQTFEGRQAALGQANKLTRSYANLVQTLDKHRGKGEQKVTVEHVHVHRGGQAIVGSVTRTGLR